MRNKKKKKDKIQAKIDELNKQIAALKRRKKAINNKKAQNNSKIHNAEEFRQQLIENATFAEKRFAQVAAAKRIDLEFQYPIYIKRYGYIDNFYIVDFCDTLRKLVFEIDGGYHNDDAQMILDEFRTRDLQMAGYRVFRISNEDVLSGKATAFLYKSYKSIGWDILAH